jgi:hypothetical protein
MRVEAKMSRLGVCIALLPLVGTAPGCSYLHHVAKDASETLHIGVGVSTVPGLRAAALAPLIAWDAGYLSGAKYVGTDYGYTSGWNERAGGILIVGDTERSEFGHSLDAPRDSDTPQNTYLNRGEFFFPIIFKDLRLSPETNMNVSKVEAELHVLFLGVSIGIDFAQFADLLTGLVGWDLLDDDGFVPRRVGEELPAKKPAID